MLDPTTFKFQKAQEIHRTGQAVGVDRPVGRVTWSKASLLTTKSAKDGMGTVRYLDKSAPATELLGIRTIERSHSIGTDSATCTITLYNVRPDFGRPEGLDTAGSVGYLTPGRGRKQRTTTSVFANAQTTDYFTGLSTPKYPTDWSYSVNPFRDVLVPNTVIRTYEGYGSDNFDANGNERDLDDLDYVAPKDDGKLFQTGLWLIDKVTFSADGIITVECRDSAKLLIEQYIYPPMLPMDRFPLIYCPASGPQGHKESIGANVATFSGSSVDEKFGFNQPQYGHQGSHAFDGDEGSFWLSGPNIVPGDIEWLQAATSGSVNEIILNLPFGNTLVYVCVHENGAWLGDQIVEGTSGNSYNLENLSAGDGNGGDGFFYVIVPGDTLWDIAGTYYGDNYLWPIIAEANSNIIKDPHWIYPGQNIKIPYVAGTLSPPPPPPGPTTTGGTKVVIPYVMMTTVPTNGRTTIQLPDTYDCDYIRIVFGNLTEYPSGSGEYRAACSTFIAHNHIPNTYVPATIGQGGYIQDWNEPIKEMCAWAGLTWVDLPDGVSADPVIGSTDGTSNWFNANHSIQTESTPLRVWGDFEGLGAGPVVCTPADYFVSKSFMEGIRLIADFIGAIFWIDGSGGAQFRLPNIWSGGNFINDPDASTALDARISDYPIEFHEGANLMSYEMTISDESLRSEVLVIGGYPSVNSTGPVSGGYVLGYNAATGTTSAIDFSNILAGQYRLMTVPGDASKLFYTQQECQRMAELTAMFILFTYRSGTLTAPGHPGLQIDDQVRIFERVTNESYVHYVSTIHSVMNLESGAYTMTVTTHWLGNDPDTDWFINKNQLTPAVLNLPAILTRIGREAGGDVFENPPYGTA